MKISEIKPNSKKEKLLLLTKTLRGECSKFINSTSKPIYRGSKNYGKALVQEIAIRSDRKPQLSSELTTNCFNLVVERKFGIERIRNMSLFCSTDLEVSEKFGEVAYVFPKNDSKILVLGGVTDSLATMEFMYNEYKYFLSVDGIFNPSLDEVKTLREAKTILNKNEYQMFLKILDVVFEQGNRRMKFNLVDSSGFNEISKMRINELLIFDTNSAWAITGAKNDDKTYTKLLSTLKGEK